MDNEENKEFPEDQASPADQDVSSETETEEKRLELALREAEQLKEQLLRKAAEFENYKRRIDGEFRSIIENATERLIVDLIPVLDDCDRLLKSTSGETSIETLRQGFELITSKLNKVLMTRGLRPFDSIGKPFDVNYHDALLQVPQKDVPPNTVVEEISRGFMLNDRIVRHAKVVVSAAADDSDQSTPLPDSNNVV